MTIIKSIQNRIYEIRGERVLLDKDLADLYEVPTKSLNLGCQKEYKTISKRFHVSTHQRGFESLRFQIETSNNNANPLRFQVETLDRTAL
ncbi:MAG TPA: ORF6N domain-containing protein [Chitinophagaceae bacterium]|nr:ORF6N domain-containing protein [Chitinophagaceae bacterium]